MLDLSRKAVEGFHDDPLLLRGKALSTPKAQGKQQQVNEHGRKGLGGRHAHLRTRFQHEGQVRFAHHGAGRHVTEGEEGQIAPLPRQAKGGQRVRRFPRLGQGHKKRLRRDGHRAIAKFTGNLHGTGKARERLNPVAGHGGRVEARAAGHQGDGLGFIEDRLRAHPEGPFQDLILGNPSLQRRHGHLRLLVDFLQHVVGVAALVRVFLGHLDAHRRPHLGFIVDAEDLKALPAHHHQVPFFHEDEAVRDRAQGQGVGREVHLPNAHPHHQGTALARGDQLVRVVRVKHDEPIGPFQPLYRLAYGFPEIAAIGIDVVNQVDHRFRVRFRFKDVAQALKLPAQGFMVFDNPVVNQGQAVPGHVRVGVLFAGDPMGGPAGVGNADGSRRRGLGERLPQRSDLTEAARAMDRSVFKGGHPSGVVAAILKALEAREQYFLDFPSADDAYDAAHSLVLILDLLGTGLRRLPTRNAALPAPAHGEGFGVNVLGNGGPSPKEGAIAHRKRRHEGAVRADENIIAEHRGVLTDAIVITGDGPGAHVHALAQGGVPKVGQMVGLAVIP